MPELTHSRLYLQRLGYQPPPASTMKSATGLLTPIQDA